MHTYTYIYTDTYTCTYTYTYIKNHVVPGRLSQNHDKSGNTQVCTISVTFKPKCLRQQVYTCTGLSLHDYIHFPACTADVFSPISVLLVIMFPQMAHVVGPENN